MMVAVEILDTTYQLRLTVGVLLAGGALTLLCLYHAYRAANAVRLYRSLSGISPDDSPTPVDGETVTIEGNVVVDEEAPLSNYATDEQLPPIAMYVWRAAFPRSGQRVVDLKDGESEQAKATFASGIEFGSFTLTTEDGDVQIDPSWLRDTHNATRLGEVRPVGFLPSRTWRVYLWNSPYIQLTKHVMEMSLERVRRVIDADSDIELEDDYFASRAVPAGTQLTVHGEVSINDGTPVLGGADNTPLFISDDGLSGIHDSFRHRTLKYSVFLVLALGADTLAILAFS